MLNATKPQPEPIRPSRRNGRHLAALSTRQRSVLSFVPPGRTLHVVDIENEAGGTEVDRNTLDGVLNSYMVAARHTDGDHMILGCNPALAVTVKSLASGTRVVHRHGRDGADLALLEAAGNAAWIAERYHRVVIGSGDHIFANLALEPVTYGVPVNVVSRPSALSCALYRIPSVVIVSLDPDEPEQVSA